MRSPSAIHTSRPSTRSMCGTWSCSCAGKPCRPHVGRLGEVRVDVDHVEAVEEVGVMGSPFHRSGFTGQRVHRPAGSQASGFTGQRVHRPRGRSPTTSSASSAAISSSVQPSVGEDLVVVLADGRRGSAHPAIDAAVAERHRGDRVPTDHRMVDHLVEAAGARAARVRDTRRGSTAGAAGTPAPTSSSTASPRSVGRRPLARDARRAGRGGARRPAMRGELGIERPARAGRARRPARATARRSPPTRPATARDPGTGRGPAARPTGCGCRRARARLP